MSVILFSKGEVFQELADAYEGLKPLLRPIASQEEEDEEFYLALRRLYFANVATYLCQYHDETPLSAEELQGIDPFVGLQGHTKPLTTKLVMLYTFLSAWGLVKYNLTTNAGETYE